MKKKGYQLVAKIAEWLAQHNPFPQVDSLLSINSGVVGINTLNCHMAQEIGTLAMAKIFGNNFGSIKFKRKDAVISLGAAKSTIKVENIPIFINPLLLFQRICIIKKSDEELKRYFKFELAPYPLSLFTEDGMRKGTKSSLFKAFSPVTLPLEPDNDILHVIDGGCLLHRVVWHRNDSYKQICINYIQYVQRHYGHKAVVVFDGYPANAASHNTKSAERYRRSRAYTSTSTDVIFDEAMIPPVSQEKFLSSENNKRSLISMLMTKFQENNYKAKQAVEDADVLIIQTAIDMSSSFTRVFVVGEDIDLLVLLTAKARDLDNIFLLKPARGKVAETLYSTRSLKYKDTVANNILFLHAISGCDTTSALFNQGKLKFLSLLDKNDSLVEAIAIFQELEADVNALARAGEFFLLALYGGSFEKDTLDSLRYQYFTKSVSKNKFLASLPPTRDAARLHCLRVYQQVAMWCGREKDPEQYGWQKRENGLDAIRTTSEAAPDDILRSISCKCKKGCTGACGCRKIGLKCSVLCLHCNGTACENIPDLVVDSDPEDIKDADDSLVLEETEDI